MNTLIHLIYTSSATKPFSEADLIELLMKSRAKNSRVGITGMLLYTESSFFQVLEGEADKVDELAQRITQDPRHTSFVTIIREPIAKRSFGEWTMGFASITPKEVEDIVGLNDFFAHAACFGQMNQGRAKKLLGAFKDGRWRSKVKHTGVPAEPVKPSSVIMRLATMKHAKVSFAYQPIVDSTTRSVVSFEAEVRGLHNEPSESVLQHVTVDERSHFDTDCRALAIAMAARLGLSCCLNLRFLAVNATDARSAIRSTLELAEKEGIDPSRLVLEVDQDRLLTETELVANVIQEYRGAGLRISINHFGAGRAGLNLLEPYRPEMIALNEQLVRGIDTNGPRQAIVRGVAQTCLDLGIDIVAKHINTVEEYQWFCDEGVTLFQGNLFAPPAFEQLPTVSFPIIDAPA